MKGLASSRMSGCLIEFLCLNDSLAGLVIAFTYCRVQTAFLHHLHSKPDGQHCKLKGCGAHVGRAGTAWQPGQVQQEPSAHAQPT